MISQSVYDKQGTRRWHTYHVQNVQHTVDGTGVAFVVGHGLLVALLHDGGGKVRDLIQETVVGQHALHQQLAQFATDQGRRQRSHSVVLLV